MYQQDESGQITYQEYNKKHVNIRIEQPIKHYAPAKNIFKLSNNPNRYSEQATLNLQKMKRIAQLLMQNKITVIFHIFQLKLLNRLNDGFHLMNQATEPHLQAYTIKEVMKLKIDTFSSKMNNLIKQHTSKNRCVFMTNLKLMFGKGRNENSKREIQRVNSKIERQIDEFDYFDKNVSNEATKSTQKLNKMLKKQKDQKEKDFESFKNQMDQLLSYHQSYLSKKH